ncbi:CaiB/BaiF CoA-transferase family protein [Pseudomaricurvus sp. HS19]|uniref:CaiB/BaiF CoA transferase family protein n=1 Tax=Pseudomaricurvus sp. HS19 TaxID=2692626 RepID=UPI00136A19E9|nr:CaiB/BaiF CoA-transferase family protein [Pseudomaricurvus sp. HS19]MYM62439.1 CoA transferase [Pseudomaricurvus sp. HS19]
MTDSQALQGVRVLDLTRVLAGPFCGQILGDLGAEVIKIERPGVGDDGRMYGFSALKDKDGNPTRESAFYLTANRNKKSITCNLSKPEGQDLVRRLVAECDVLIENYKVGNLQRYGLDYDSLKEINPRLIYCSITGYGQTGPMAPKPGYDGLFQATGGMMAVTGIPAGQPGAGPLKAGPSLVDVFTGHNAALAILGALNQRHTTGQGQYIDVALLDCSVAMVSHIMQDFLVSGNPPPRLGNGGNGGGPADLINCADGIIYITAGTDEHWRLLTELMARPDLFDDPRFNTNPKRGTNRNELVAIINQWSMGWKAAELLAALDGIGLPAARYNELPDVWEDEQVQHRNLKVTVPHPTAGEVTMIASPLAYMSGSPVTYTAPPTIGQHTEELLGEGLLNLSAEEIGQLRDAGII